MQIPETFPLASLTFNPASPFVDGSQAPEASVLDSKTGKYPRPLEDNPKNPALLEANRILAAKHAQHPRR